MIPPQHYSSPMMSPPFNSLSHSLPPSLPPRCVGTIGPPSHSRRGSIPMPSGGTCFMYGMSVCTCSRDYISVHCIYIHVVYIYTCIYNYIQYTLNFTLYVYILSVFATSSAAFPRPLQRMSSYSECLNSMTSSEHFDIICCI